MRPKYVARTSIWRQLTFGKILLWLLMLGMLVPLFMFCWKPLVVKMDLAIVFFAIAAVFVLVPVIWFIVDLIIVRSLYTEFYKDKIIQHWGVLHKDSRNAIFLGVAETTLCRPFWGRILGYGHVKIDCAGQWDFDVRYVKKPKRLVRYLNFRSVKVGKNGRFVEI